MKEGRRKGRGGRFEEKKNIEMTSKEKEGELEPFHVTIAELTLTSRKLQSLWHRHCLHTASCE